MSPLTLKQAAWLRAYLEGNKAVWGNASAAARLAYPRPRPARPGCSAVGTGDAWTSTLSSGLTSMA